MPLIERDVELNPIGDFPSIFDRFFDMAKARQNIFFSVERPIDRAIRLTPCLTNFPALPDTGQNILRLGIFGIQIMDISVTTSGMSVSRLSSISFVLRSICPRIAG